MGGFEINGIIWFMEQAASTKILYLVWLQVIKYVKFLSYPPKKGRIEKSVSGFINLVKNLLNLYSKIPLKFTNRFSLPWIKNKLHYI